MAQRFSWALPEALDEAERPVELLGAHGFLPHSLLKPILNRRTDSYRASLGIRMRYPSKWPPRSREVRPRYKAIGIRDTGAVEVD